MTLVVPFDGSELSRAALVRATQFDTVLDEGVMAVTVIPEENADYAAERGWIDANESFDLDAITSHLGDAVAEVAPAADFHSITVDRYAPRGTIAKALRRFAQENDASIVFVGTDNAGRIVGGLTVGKVVMADKSYDTMVVSHLHPPTIDILEERAEISQHPDDVSTD